MADGVAGGAMDRAEGAMDGAGDITDGASDAADISPYHSSDSFIWGLYGVLSEIMNPLVPIIVTAIWLMLPAYLPNNFAVIFGGGTPLDLGRTFNDGKRITGDGKTYRGTVAGAAFGVLAGLLMNLVAPYIGLPTFGEGIEQIPILVGLSLGAMAGDIVASFFKRRMGLKRGAQLFFIDQLDFVFGAWALTFLLAPAWFIENFTLPVIAVVLVVTPLLHRVTNIIGYKIGAKKEPW